MGGGLLIWGLSVFGMLSFSCFMFFNVSLVMVWLFLELSNLSLIPLFFCGGGLVSVSGLFYYVIFTGVSSGLMLMGLLLPECFFFLIGGFLMKFGVFPFCGWVYRVCSASSWSVVWGISSLLKVSFILFPVFIVLGDSLGAVVVSLSAAGCIFLSLLFWAYCYGWKVCWCHIMLSSSMVLVGLSVSGCGLSMLLWVYLVYFVWSSLVLLFLSFYGDGVLYSGGLGTFLFSFLLLTLPCSVPIVYKLLVASCVFSCGLCLSVSWVFYSLSEQFYLFFLLTGCFSGKGGANSLDLV